MRKLIRYCLTTVLVSSMLLSQSICSFAETGYGPGYASTAETTSSYGPGTVYAETEAPTAPAESTAEETSAQITHEEGEALDSQAAAELQEESAAAAAEAAEEQSGPLTVPVRQPHLQATVLIADGEELEWSQPFVNDQWITVDGKAFCSISIFMTEMIGNIHYRAYTSEHGWTQWVMNGQQTPLGGSYAPIEAIQIRFSGVVHNEFDIYYTTSLSDGSETGWAKNSATAGTMNDGKRLTGFRMAFFRRSGDTPSLNMSNPVVSAHADGIQYVDGQLRYIHGDGSGFTGWGWNDTERYYFADSVPVTGWQYIDGYKFYFAEDGKLVQDLEPIIGANGPFHLMINKEMNTMTVYAKDGDNGFIIPLKSFLLSTGDDTPLGTFKTPEKYRWRLMNSGVYAQYATRLGSGLPFLLHSIIYDKADSYTVWASTYNHLGVARSAGCIRLLSSDAKWIYDHCAVGTSITVYNSGVPGPYERPVIPFEIPFEQTWDPSDPNVTAAGIEKATADIMAKFGS